MEAARWRKTLLPAGASLQDAIGSLNESGLQIVLVVADDDALLGTVTDGDIRRAILRGLTMTESIETVVQKEALVVPLELGRDMVLHLMRANSVHQLPIVDDHRKVVGLHSWDELLTLRPRHNLMVIMAGGRGRRLEPQTQHTPKPLLPVAGKPVLEHIIERAKAEGFQRFAIAVHYLGDMIEEHFGDGSPWGVELSYIHEPAPLGTVGAVALLNPRPGEPFVVSNGDIISDVHYGELLDFHIHQEAMATMAVRLHEWEHPFGVVQTEGMDIVGFEEKPVIRSHVNAGVYVLEPAALGVLEKGERCDMPTLFTRLREKGEKTIAYPMHEPWLDLGRPDDLRLANERLSRAKEPGGGER
jgi:dTDP-glucose pyrophosphorylase